MCALLVACTVSLGASAQSPVGQANSVTDNSSEQTAFSQARDRWIKRSRYRRLLAAVYRENGGGPIFFQDGQPTAVARTLYFAVKSLDKHAVDRSPYWLGYGEDNYQWKEKKKQPRRKRRQPPQPLELVSVEEPLKVAEFDVRLAHALTQYVVDFRVLHKAHPRYQQRKLESVLQRAETDILGHISRLLTVDQMRLESLWPKTSAYKVLLAARSKYRELRQKEKAKELRLPKLNWRRWRRAYRKKKLPEKLVTGLQVRLAIEEFYLGEPHGRYDYETDNALRRARRAHNLLEDGGVDYYFAIRANKSIRYRLDAINVSLQRLRESARLRRGLSSYIRINIPAFELEVVEHGRVTRRHRVIVGNNKLDFNRHDWKQGYLNRTPLLETQVKQVIVNPRWRPPPRILDEEFEGQEKVIVEPGPKNPLGYVKFTLERTNAVFMHDTNKRAKFQKTVRAYSHGCIRVHEALDLAEYITTRYTDTDTSAFSEAHQSKQTRTFKLSTELPLFVEYQTVDEASSGELRFFPDVYRYDRAWVRGNAPINQARYGGGRLRPKNVPSIPHDDYKRLKAAGGKAPTEWPVGGASPDAVGGGTAQEQVVE